MVLRAIACRASLALIVSSIAVPAAADDAEDFIWASNMATVIGSADTCGFALSKDKVDAFVRNRIAKFDAGTRANFYNTLTVMPDALASLSPTARAAQCSLQHEVAKREGLTP